jgi:hypothetical protein
MEATKTIMYKNVLWYNLNNKWVSVVYGTFATWDEVKKFMTMLKKDRKDGQEVNI